MTEDLEFLKEIIDEFLEDAVLLTAEIDARLLELEGDPQTPTAAEPMARALHTLRMQSSFLEFDSLSEVALGMERLLDWAQQDTHLLDLPALDLLHRGRQVINQALSRLREHDTTPFDSGDLPDRLQAALEGSVESVPTVAPSAAVEIPEVQVARIGGNSDPEEDLPTHEVEEEAAPSAADAVEAVPEEPQEAESGEVAVELEEVEVAEGAVGEDVVDFVPDFIVESTEILEKLDGDLVRLEEASDDPELLNEIFRAAHTLKGTSAFLGFAQMSDLTHKMESVLDLLRKGEMAISQAVMDVILRGVDQIKILQADIAGNAIVRRELDDLRGELLLIATTRGAIAGIPSALRESPAAPNPPPAPETSPPPPAAAPPRSTPAPQIDQVMRIDVGRVDQIVNLTEELVLGRNRLLQVNSQLSGQYGEDELVNQMSEATGQVEMLTGELQESVMKMRMVPVGRVFSRFPRLVRDLARDLDKQTELVIEDNDTEIDKSVADEIGDPLVHLIRNAVDHGIESPEVRQQAGKEPKGTVLLSAVHEGNHIVIRIRDNGAGMDPDLLRRKAVEKSILSEEEAAHLDDEEACHLIFAPGFSTAGEITDVSGRGVGMDVVKTNITRLNGTIELDSTLGAGTSITIRLPLTLAIIGGLQIGMGEEMFIIPLTSVIKALRISSAEIESLQGHPAILARGKVLPLIELDRMLETPGRESRSEVGYVVIVGLAERRVGILVDRLLGQVDVVIKGLDERVGPAHGIAGATILGNGRVCLILDVGELITRMDGEREGRSSSLSD
jgi:two-component system, chemotaxis family, sensor kinase CheA